MPTDLSRRRRLDERRDGGLFRSHLAVIDLEGGAYAVDQYIEGEVRLRVR